MIKEITPEVRAFIVANAKKGNAKMRERYSEKERREWAKRGGKAGKGVKKTRNKAV